MKVIQINNTDLQGARFNGQNVQKRMNDEGMEAGQIVLIKEGNDDHTTELLNGSLKKIKHILLSKGEYVFSKLNESVSYYDKIVSDAQFKDSDLVHYHLIHNKILSIEDFLKISKLKKTIWTIHDPWAFTGHCIYPLHCEKWKDGCKCCADLNRSFKIKKDYSSELWQKKYEAFRKLDVDIIVASNWMKNMLEQSSFFSENSRVHLIPFGIDLNVFTPQDKGYLRKKYGILDNENVILFRSDPSAYKGLDFICEYLDVNTNKLTIITVGMKGLLQKYSNKYKIIEFGWVNDEECMSEIYNLCDVFLMPSTAEAFGVMAIEAMACGIPVIVAEGTSLPEVVDSPRCGISVHYGDVQSLSNEISKLFRNKAYYKDKSEKSRALAIEKYDFETYYNQLVNLYKEVYNRKCLVK